MYNGPHTHSKYIDAWFHRKAGCHSLPNHLRLAEKIRAINYPVKIKLGLEVCYFKEYEELVRRQTKDLALDFLVGSVHFADNFAFDHKAEHWEGAKVDQVFRHYFEISADLARSALYNGIDHPDAIRLFGHRPSFFLEDDYNRLSRYLAASGMYAEMNSGCHRRAGCELGMVPELAAAMKRHGVTILTASDAHCPEDIGAGILRMERMLDGITPESA